VFSLFRLFKGNPRKIGIERVPTSRHFAIHEGRGIDDQVIVGQSTIEDVIATFGEGYELEYEKEGSNISSYRWAWIRYREFGLSFSFVAYRSGPFEPFGKHKLNHIYLTSPSMGTTERGVEVGKDSVNFVLAKYGPPSRRLTHGRNAFSIEYAFLGVDFSFKMNQPIPKPPFTDEYLGSHREAIILSASVYKSRPDAQVEVGDIFRMPDPTPEDIAEAKARARNAEFWIQCAHCGRNIGKCVYGYQLESAASGAENSRVFGVDRAGLFVQCGTSTCRGYNRIVPQAGNPQSFVVERYPSPTEEQAFTGHHSVVCEYGCPYCNPRKAIKLEGFHDYCREIIYQCCGTTWSVLETEGYLMWSSRNKSSGSSSLYFLRDCPTCLAPLAYYEAGAGSTRVHRCYKCGHSDWEEVW